MVALSFPNPPLADEVVALRPWRKADIPQRFAGFSDPVCLRFSWPCSEPFTEAHVRADLEEHERGRLEGREVNLAVVDVAARDHVWGGAAVYEVDGERSCASLGFWLAAHARGRGIATRAVRLLARWCFDRLELARLQLTCAPDNEASRRVAERCGFSREGLLRAHLPFRGARRDTVVYGLLPGELR
ncbi:GNAT family N-acetyltransferase [Actinopolyspora mortivallis]|uniref:GNAT family N-acetyltransferase n=1 Tax=Actinopolyspora mortivallis TaxID=33906 RepID=UPI00037BCEC0|nr:GNAT family protein [Actinopolyspora mortivallis]